MPLNKQSGNMYGFVTHTWNAIRGHCEHECEYCYIKALYDGKLFNKPCRIEEKELKTNLGKGNYIFVGSSTDMFGEWVIDDWIEKVVSHCKEYDNKYLFQSKNVENMYNIVCAYYFPENSTFATTIESNRHNEWSKAPNVIERAYYLRKIGNMNYGTMVTIEPILDFDLDEMISLLKLANPNIVTIGADSKRHNLPEPSKEKAHSLIRKLTRIKDVVLKDNLGRLIK